MKISRIICFAMFILAGAAAGQNRTAPHMTSHLTFFALPVDTPNFSVPFTVNGNDLYSYGINFGIHPNATSGIDPSLGEREYPPFPPCCGFTMFVTTGGNAILDLLPYTSPAQIDTYQVGLAAESTSYPITFSWPNLQSYYSGSVRLKSDLSGSLFDIDMKAVTSYKLTSGPFIDPNLPPPGVPTLSVYIVAEGPLSGNSPPVVSTYGVGSGGFQAIVNAGSGGPLASVAPLGPIASTTAWFDYGPTRSYGTSTAVQTIPAGKDSNISSPFSPGDLPPNTRIHFRAVAVDGNGTHYGGDRVVSNGTPAPESIDTTHYRSATYRDW